MSETRPMKVDGKWGLWISPRDALTFYMALESGWENEQIKLMDILEPFEDYDPENKEFDEEKWGQKFE